MPISPLLSTLSVVFDTILVKQLGKPFVRTVVVELDASGHNSYKVIAVVLVLVVAVLVLIIDRFHPDDTGTVHNLCIFECDLSLKKLAQVVQRSCGKSVLSASAS